MPNTSYLSNCPNTRAQLVAHFNVNALRLLTLYGGFSTTQLLRVYTQYSDSGVRKRLNHLLEMGLVHKIKTHYLDTGIKSFWAVTKQGAELFKVQDDASFFDYPVRSCLSTDIKPSQINHILHTQAVVSRIEKSESRDIKHAKALSLGVLDVTGRLSKKSYVPDAILRYGENSEGDDLYAAIEVEITPKTIARYQEIFERISGAIGSNTHHHSYIFNGVYYFCPRNVYRRILKIFESLKSPSRGGLKVYLTPYSELKNFSFQDEQFLVRDF